MLRNFILAFFIVAGFADLVAQNIIDAKTATVVSYWNVGDAKTYQLDRTKTGRKNSKATMFLDLHVLEGTDSTYTIALHYRDMKVLDELPADENAAQAILKVMKSVDGMRVVATTTATGSFLEVINGEEIKQHCDKIIQGILDLSTSAEEREKMKAAFGKLITPETMAMTASEDLSYLLFPFGVEYTLGKNESGKTELPNPLGGEPIPAVIEVEMTGLDTTLAKATFHASQRVDPANLSASVTRMVETMGGTLSGKEKKEFEKVVRDMRVSDVFDFEVDLGGAWVREGKCVRTVSMMDQVQTDERRYTLQ